MVTPPVLVLKPFANFTETTQSPSEIKRREEGGELDSQEEASPEEIKSREVVLG